MHCEKLNAFLYHNASKAKCDRDGQLAFIYFCLFIYLIIYFCFIDLIHVTLTRNFRKTVHNNIFHI